MKINISGTNSYSRHQKILLTLYKLSGGTSKQIRFEDIAVEAFKNYPSDFQLRGYPQYPDTGDIIHKPLYSELKKAGYVLSGNKFFSLTPKGIEFCKKLLGFVSKAGKASVPIQDKLTAVQQREIERIKDSTAFELYSQSKKEDILDIDFYSYLGVTVRTDKNDFVGRLNTVEDAIGSLRGKSNQLYLVLTNLHKYLLEKYKSNMDYILASKGGRG